MPRLPQPSTLSPGFIVLAYVTGVIEHHVRVRLLADADVTDLTSMRGSAILLAEATQQILTDICTIHDWILQNADGVELFTEPFTSPYVGTSGSFDGGFAQSFSADIIGRGEPDIGLAQGNTRYMVFPGRDFTADVGPKIDMSGDAEFDDILSLLNTDTVMGADIYGTKAAWSPLVATQYNAHWQKRYGK